MPDEPTPASDDERGPVDHLLDLCVYAPLGLALEGRSLVPTLAERGRAQVGMARMIGQFAVKWGSTRVERALLEAQEQAVDLLRRSGVTGRTGEEPAHPAAPDEATAPLRDEAPPPLAPVPEAPEPGPPVDVDTLAIPDYDNLSASQVVPRLEGLTAEELDLVRRYEWANRGRRTILTRIAQLQAPAD